MPAPRIAIYFLRLAFLATVFFAAFLTAFLGAAFFVLGGGAAFLTGPFLTAGFGPAFLAVVLIGVFLAYLTGLALAFFNGFLGGGTPFFAGSGVAAGART